MIEKHVARALLCASVVAGLAGCSGDDGSGPDASAQKSTVVVTVTGAVDSTLSTRGSIFCSPNDLSGPDYVFELYAMDIPQQFNLRMNRDTEPGTYPIVGSDDPEAHRGADAHFYYTGPGRERFNKVRNGSITLEKVPTAAGEPFVATIGAEVVDGDGATINLDARINMTAGMQSFDECP